MPTPSEQKALTFVAMIVLLGGAVRVVRAGGTPGASRLEQQALARQQTAVESAAASTKARPGTGRGTRARKASADSTRESRTSEARSRAGPKAVAQGLNGFPPPGPRIDVDYRPNYRAYRSEVSATAIPPLAAMGGLIDLDRAAEREIDALPRVGPALARRLVANRDSFGAFGSLEALGRVRGFGPATRKRLSPLVTFSGGPSSRP